MKILFAICSLCAVAATASANNVLPAIGGDQVGVMDGAPMRHILIDFDGTDLTLDLDDHVATPFLRELTGGNQFDPAEPWAVLSGKAHNFQHGWLPASAWAPPVGLAVYVEQLSVSPGLEVYEGGRFMSEATIRQMTFDPLFESGTPWVFGGVMTHNAYAVANPTESSYSASYRVYLGDETTGIEPTDGLGAPLYGSDTVTLDFNTVPVPEPASIGLLSLAGLAALRRGRR